MAIEACFMTVVIHAHLHYMHIYLEYERCSSVGSRVLAVVEQKGTVVQQLQLAKVVSPEV